VIITLPLFLAGMQIGGKVASTLLEEKNPNLAKNIETLVGSFTAGASLVGAFKSPNIAQTPTSTEGSGYNSQIPGVQGFGKGNSIFDPNFNTNQLGIQSPYNNTPDYFNF